MAEGSALAVPDPELAEYFIERIERYAQPKPRNRDRLSASQAHRCLRAVVLEAQGAKLPPVGIKGLLAFASGHAYHDLIQSAFQGDEFAIETEHKTKFVIGHSDLWIKRQSLMIDIKSMNVEDWCEFAASGKVKPEHVSQCTWYGAQEKCEFGAIVGVNKNGKIPAALKRKYTVSSDVIAAVRFRIDPTLAAEYEEKGRLALEHLDNDTIPPFEELPECRFCPVAAACAKAYRRESKEASRV